MTRCRSRLLCKLDTYLAVGSRCHKYRLIECISMKFQRVAPGLATREIHETLESPFSQISRFCGSHPANGKP